MTVGPAALVVRRPSAGERPRIVEFKAALQEHERRLQADRRLLEAAAEHCRAARPATLRIATLAANHEALVAYRAAGFADYEVALVRRLRPLRD